MVRAASPARLRLRRLTGTPELPYTLLDVFTDVRLAGNPLAVVHDADALDERTMLAFAIETKLSETSFVQTRGAAGADYRNRTFSMAGELPFAGHPSLGTAVAVARRRGVSGEAVYVQETGAGLQPIEVLIEGDAASASMLQEPPRFGPELDPTPLLAALGLDDRDAHPDLPPQAVSTGLRQVMLPLRSMAALARIASEPRASVRPGRPGGRGSGTGSAAGPRCAYLHARTGCAAVGISQGVALGRPSRLEAEIAGDRVRVAGRVVPVIDGVLTFRTAGAGAGERKAGLARQRKAGNPDRVSCR